MIKGFLLDLILAIWDRFTQWVERKVDERQLIEDNKRARTLEEKREIARRASELSRK